MLPQRLGRIALPTTFWMYVLGSVTVLLGVLFASSLHLNNSTPNYHIAMIGNSMMYYNDLPRFLEELSLRSITTDVCLHGNADFSSMLLTGSGMYRVWRTGNARNGTSYDYGKCTVKQLLTGYDADLDQQYENIFGEQQDDDDDNDQAQTTIDDDASLQYGDDYFSFDDGMNPCLRDRDYYPTTLLSSQQESDTQQTTFDFVIMNDNTRTPANIQKRQDSLSALLNTYEEWLLASKATPIFLATYAYESPYRDMKGLGDVGTFTSYTMAGYVAYQSALRASSGMEVRIAPVCMVFLKVYEDNPELWNRMFHTDQLHVGPMGTYLQGLVVYHTIYGHLPSPSVAVTDRVWELFRRARRLGPTDHRTDAFPTLQEARYLYQACVDVLIHKRYPDSFVEYTHGEGVDFEPNDDYYRVDDIY